MILSHASRIGRLTPPLNTSPGNSTLTVDRASILDNNTDLITATVTVLDKNGAPVVGATVVPSYSGSGGTLSTPAVTNAAGVTTFTLKSSVAGASKVISATANGIGITQTQTVSVTSSGYTIAGSVALDAGGAAASQEIQLWTNGFVTLLATLTADGSGNWVTGTLASGNSYSLRVQPLLGKMVGATDGFTTPGETTVAIAGANVTGVAFKVAPANFYDNFQSYTTTADLRTNGFLNTRSVVTATSASGGFAVTDQAGGFTNPNPGIVLNPTGGPHGGKSMQYQFPDRTSFVVANISAANPSRITVTADGTGQPVVPLPTGSVCEFSGTNSTPLLSASHYYAKYVDDTHFDLYTDTNLTNPGNVTGAGNAGTLTGHIQCNIHALFRFYDGVHGNSQLTSSELWLMLDERMYSPNAPTRVAGQDGWVNGAGDGNYDFFEYKFLQWYFTTGSSVSPGVQFLLQGGHAGNPVYSLVAEVISPDGSTHAGSMTLNTFGVWRRWHFHLIGVGTGTYTVEAYLNGVFQFSKVVTGVTGWASPSYITAIAIGSNQNSGPAVVGQVRDFALVHLSTARPRLVAGEAP